jgi:hypothetical protein
MIIMTDAGADSYGGFVIVSGRRRLMRAGPSVFEPVISASTLTKK